MGAMSCCECRRKDDGFFKSFTDISSSDNEGIADDLPENSVGRTSQYLSLLYSVGSSKNASLSQAPSRSAPSP